MDNQRPLLTDRQCRIFLKDMKDFGYTNLTFEEVRKMANDLHAGKENDKDAVAIILRQQIDEAMRANY